MEIVFQVRTILDILLTSKWISMLFRPNIRCANKFQFDHAFLCGGQSLCEPCSRIFNNLSNDFVPKTQLMFTLPLEDKAPIHLSWTL
jgi:hypothetical protein